MKGLLDASLRDNYQEPLIEGSIENSLNSDSRPSNDIDLHVTTSSSRYVEDVDDTQSFESDDESDRQIGVAYDDFHTIDWVRDQAEDRKRHKITMSRSRSYRLMDAISGWGIVFIIGCVSGLFAGIIDIGSKWLIDLKEGYCSEGWYLDKEACCWSNSTIISEAYCGNWVRWGSFFVGSDSPTALSYILNYFFYVSMGIGLALVTVVFVMQLAPYASGSGIPEVKTILSGFIIRGYLGMSTLAVKSVGLIVAVASGLSLGKEGPLVHVSCCIGNCMVRLFPKFSKNEAKKREVLSAAAAAGVSVAFGATVGGVLFSLEEVSYYFPHKTMWRSFFCAISASVVLQSLNPYSTGQSALFYIRYDYPWHFFELLPFAILGLIGGLLGAAFIKANIWWCVKRKTTKLGHHPLLEVLVIALITGLVGFINPFTRKSTSSLIKELFSVCEWEDNSMLCDYNFIERSTINNGTAQASNIAWGPPASGLNQALWQLLAAAIVKSVLTVFTFGLKVPAGLFIPSLAVGGCLGRVMGVLVQYLLYLNRNSTFLIGICPDMSVCTLTGLYAMVGAAAVLSGVTRMTVSLVVIMFELTGGITYIVPIMVAVMIAKWVGDAITPGGIYDAHISLNGYPYLDGKDRFMFTSLGSDVMKPERGTSMSVLDAETVTIDDIQVLLETTEYHGFPVIASIGSKHLVGFAMRTDLLRAISSARDKHIDLVNASRVYFTETVPRPSGGPIGVSFSRFIDKTPVCLEPTTPMADVIDMFTKLGLSQVLITHRGKLKGIITKKDVLRHVDMLNRDKNSALFRG